VRHQVTSTPLAAELETVADSVITPPTRLNYRRFRRTSSSAVWTGIYRPGKTVFRYSERVQLQLFRRRQCSRREFSSHRRRDELDSRRRRCE